jgi:hypothetical protein
MFVKGGWTNFPNSKNCTVIGEQIHKVHFL